MSITPIIQYLRECFLLDNRTPALSNIFHDKFEDLYILDGEEHVLRDELPYYPIAEEYAETVDSKLAVYKKEKSLYYGLYLLTGQDHSKPGSTGKLCAPLFLFPAQVVKTDMGDYGIAIERDKLVVNVRDLFRLKEQEEDLYASYVHQIPAEFWTEAGFMQFCRLLEEKFSGIDTGAGVSYPGLTGEKEIKKEVSGRKNKAQEELKLLPAAFFAVLNNPPSFTGVLDELEQLTAEADYSTALKALFNVGPQLKKPVHSHRYVAPGSLSSAQQKAIINAIEYPISLIIGPPGTGKSYTISNLAIDQLAQGKTVLIASKTDTAVDVIHHKIEGILDELLVSVRAGKRGYKRKLRAYFSNLLSGTNQYYALEKELNPFRWSKMLDAVDKELKALENDLPGKLKKAAQRGRSLNAAENRDNGLFSWIIKLFIRIEQENTQPLWIKAARIEELTEKRAVYAKKFIQGRFLFHLLFTLRKNRQEIARFDKALRSRVSGNKEKLFGQVNLGAVLGALPIWLVNLSEVSQVLPLEKELFDLAIIDEATQCDIASCLPVLQRAKKVVIVGDPKQLRHVSFLSRSAQMQLLAKYELPKDTQDLLNYRDHSILDLLNFNLASQDQLCFLNEHFRSTPSLIRFSNAQFYNSSLSLMKALPHHDKEALMFRNTAGKRCKRGTNKEEGLALLAELQLLLAAEEELEIALCKKIGVISPFRDQADYLAKLIEEEIPAEKIQKHQILVGTAYSFQGEERDVMLLSFALDNDSHHSAFRHLEKHDVFNVSITRARSVQLVFYSFDEQQLPASSLLRKYISSTQPVMQDRLTSSEGKDHSVYEQEQELENYLLQKGITYWKDYSLMGEQVDYLLKSGSSYLGIDLIGFPGHCSEDIPLEKYQAFMRAGLKIFPLPYVNWYFKKELSWQAIQDALDCHG
jgi:hypothetical protein